MSLAETKLSFKWTATSGFVILILGLILELAWVGAIVFLIYKAIVWMF